MNAIFKFILIIFLFIHFNICFSLEKTFYVIRKNPDTFFTTLTSHASSINTLITQAYHINKEGIVSGEFDSRILNFANKHSIKLMAMVTNSRFDKDIAHQFLSNSKAEQKAIDTLLKICDLYHLYGIQFDFEMIALADREALTHFYKIAAEALHKKGYRVSFAIAPILSNPPFKSFFQKRLYQVWEGAYDLRRLGTYADFVTVMAYDQHVDHVTPGPVASIRWTEAAIQHALKNIPRQKISLGIPVYSSFWYTGIKSGHHSPSITVRYNGISYDTVLRLLKKNNASLHWDNLAKVNYAIYEHNWLNEYIFVEDARSFSAKLKLAEKYHLYGISVFRVGVEDGNIWNVLHNA